MNAHCEPPKENYFVIPVGSVWVCPECNQRWKYVSDNVAWIGWCRVYPTAREVDHLIGSD